MTFTTLRTKMQSRAGIPATGFSLSQGLTDSLSQGLTDSLSQGLNESPRFVTYLDHNATTPIASVVSENLGLWAEAWGNPSSIHQAGRAPKALMRESRDRVAKMVNASPLEIIFTSGGSEANNFALKGVFEALRIKSSNRKHYLLSAVEHPCVRRAADYLMANGAEVEFIPVNRDGSIDMHFYQTHLRNDTALVSVMLANNETGNIFPIENMVQLAHERGALFHTDAVQALGKISVDLKALGVDLASFAGHKFYALKGAGFLYCKRGTPIEPLILGGGQERHRRGGTENLLAIASLGKMCEMLDQVSMQALRLSRLRDRLEADLVGNLPGLSLTGAESPRLPNSSSMVIDGVDGETLLMNLDMRGFAVSTGAACSAGSPEPSPVLIAMGLSRKEAQSSLRLGLGWETTESEVAEFIEALKSVVIHLREMSDGMSDDKSDETRQRPKNLIHEGKTPEKVRIHGNS